MPELRIAVEPWSDAFWQEAKPLAEAHFLEVDGGVEPKRRFKLDCRLMQALHDADALKIVSARRGDRLVGYFSWQITPDVESEGLMIAQQGAWYVAPGCGLVAAKMFDASVRALKACGVQCIFPHHRVQGRGANIGRFFQRRGAREIQRTYSLWIGD